MTRRNRREGRRAAAKDRPRSGAGDANSLLSIAFAHHQKGELERAKELYEQLIAAQPAHADGLQYLGILCGQCGDTQRAESLIRQAIALKPDVAAYHDNLGTVLERDGRFDDALSAYGEADQLEPGDVDRGYNLGLVLERLGRYPQAEARFRDALASRPQDADCRVALANLLKGRGKLDEALQIYREVLGLDPEHVPARINLGNVLQDRGEVEQALVEYRAVISRAHKSAVDSATVYHNQGRALLRTERFEDAQRSFEQALRHDSNFAVARGGLAQALERQGLLDRAYAAYRAVYRDDDVGGVEARAGMLRVARVLPPSRYDELLVDALFSALRAGEACASSYARMLGVQLAAKAQLPSRGFADDADALSCAVSLQEDPLFVVALEQCVNVVPEVERWLCAVRRALLHAGVGQLTGHEPLLRALALQCAANEYVFAVSDTEVGVIDAVLAQLEPHTSSGLLGSAQSVRDLLLCACYMPLTELWSSASLTMMSGYEFAPWLDLILQRTVTEPLREETIARTIPSLAPIENPASLTVRAQYEENPYPRWREMAETSGSDGVHAELVESALAGAADAPILVAGCGTGYEPLSIARRYPGRSLLAIDLSRASLAYGARMAEELGLDSLEFMQGDLLDVERLDRKFALITASGVLHHMAEPLVGWRALTRCLHEKGVMKVALYSRRARAAVNAARERVAALGLPASAQGVRELRARILAGHEVALEALLDSEDFYSTSVCRDLVFHPLEHQFDLDEVATMLDSLGLRFEGFELPHPLIRRQFHAAQLGEETDLRAWSRFEERNPQTFEAMYVMWCRKRESTSEHGDQA